MVGLWLSAHVFPERERHHCKDLYCILPLSLSSYLTYINNVTYLTSLNFDINDKMDYDTFSLKLPRG